jgi:diguanylate cyclase (GGDEF)-like protein
MKSLHPDNVEQSPETGQPQQQAAHSPSDPYAQPEALRSIGHLVEAVQKLSVALTLDEILAIAGAASRLLTGADCATIILRDGDESYYALDDSHSPQLRGCRFPSEYSVSAWVMLHHLPAIIPDLSQEATQKANQGPRIPAEMVQPTGMRSLTMVPIRAHNPIGTIGNYWSFPHRPTPEQVQLLQALADSTAVAIESTQIHRQLEDRVRERTEELEAANQELRAEAVLRKQMEARVLQLSLTDELTGLSNRRGFLLRTEQLLKLATRFYTHGWLVYIDLDGLKLVNDTLGHEAGDRLIRSAAKVLRESFRDSDVIGRIGGDEFVVFATGAATPVREIEQRLQKNVEHHNLFPTDLPPLSMSMGAVRCDPHLHQSLEDLIHQADAAMYIQKRRKQQRER